MRELAAESVTRVGLLTVDTRSDDTLALTTGFRSSPGLSVLVGDRTAEEGHNLQSADILIHVDVPWDANRMEQRLGRVDRIGRQNDYARKLLLGHDDGPHSAWTWVLVNGFSVVHASIASLQSAVRRLEQHLLLELFAGGPGALRAKASWVRSQLYDAAVELDEQNALDATEVGGTSYCGERLHADYSAADQAREAVEGWVIDVLRTRPVRHDHMVTYDFASAKLVTSDVRIELARVTGEAMSYSRLAAVRNPGLQLLRLGHPLIDTLHRLILEDDRGQVFVIWRCTTGLGSGTVVPVYRFDFVIEADADALASAARTEGLQLSRDTARRLLDWAFPPLYQSVFIDAAVRTVDDPLLTQVLAHKYKRVRDGGTDVNLDGSRLAVLFEYIPQTDWPRHCYRACERARELLCGSSALHAACQEYEVLARDEFERRVATLRVRMRVQGDCAADLRLEEFLLQTVPAQAAAPVLRLDSTGCILLAGDVHPDLVQKRNDE